MRTFRVRFVEGATAQTSLGRQFAGSRSVTHVIANDRADAFVHFCRSHVGESDDVTVLYDGYPGRSPLGFAPSEVEKIRAEGLELRDGYPRAGIQVEQVDPE